MNSVARCRRIVPTLIALTFVAGSLGALGAASCCVGWRTNSALRFLEPRRAPTVDEACVAYPIEYSLRSDEKNDVVFLGDSTCRCGIDPVYFEQLTGLRAYNLGSQGRVGPMGFLVTAKAYLLRHPPPRIMVLSMSPVAFEAEAAGTELAMQSRFLANYGPEVPGLLPLKESLLYFIKRGSLAARSAGSSFVARRDGDLDVRDLGSSDSRKTPIARSSAGLASLGVTVAFRDCTESSSPRRRTGDPCRFAVTGIMACGFSRKPARTPRSRC
jgi:hypothetical protein